MFSGKSKSLKKYARHLLATTCLTVAATTAQATTFSEGVNDFGNTFAARTGLPGGTTQVFGGVNPGNDFDDFFFFSGLPLGGAFTFTGLYEGAVNVSVLTNGNSVINGNSNLSNPPTMTGTVPGDGILVIGAHGFEGTAFYDLRLDVVGGTSQIPEPATAGLAGLALASAVALRRKTAK